MKRRFEDWVDVEGLTPGERAKLERLHNVLLDVGPPAELPRELRRPAPPSAQVIEFPALRRRRGAVALVAVAAVVAASFVGGFFIGDNSNGIATSEVVAFHGGANSFASLRVGKPDAVGNNPMVLTVSGLPSLPHGYYELFTVRNGKPSFPCAGFRITGSRMSVHFSVPYVLDPDNTKLVIMAVQRGGAAWPGRPVMHSV
jgi:uncharacterized protein (DUF2141 family)